MRASLVALVLAGCGTPAGKPARANPTIPAITLCRTTEAELRTALGPPTRDGVIHQARIMSWIIDEDVVVRYLAVLVDPSGVVVDQAWNVPTEIPWVPADQCATRTAP